MRVLSPCAGVSRQRSRSQPSRSPAFTMQIRELERQGEFSFRALGSLVSDRNPQDTGPVSTTQIRELERQGEFSFRAPGSSVMATFKTSTSSDLLSPCKSENWSVKENSVYVRSGLKVPVAMTTPSPARILRLAKNSMQVRSSRLLRLRSKKLSRLMLQNLKLNISSMSFKPRRTRQRQTQCQLTFFETRKSSSCCVFNAQTGLSIVAIA